MTLPLVTALDAARCHRQGDQMVHALRAASCRIMPDDRIVLMGPSGSGKSTLLHLLGGLDRPTSGQVEWPALGPREGLRPKRIGMILQAASLVPTLTVRENVAIPLLLLGETSTVHEAAMAALADLGLEGLADKLPEEISGGQAQRVAAARALVVSPDLVLADEPTGQLDHATAEHLLDVLLDTLAGRPCALVIATHDERLAERATGVWRLEHGRLDVAPAKVIAS